MGRHAVQLLQPDGGDSGVAAPIVNAVFHATGRRLRALPLRVERIMA